ncbi:MAG: cytochrome b [Pseudomonadales bacterium]|nr:cytochrome b [Pseudomonadales bacterium]
MKKDTQHTLGLTTRLLHWLIAITILVLIPMGISMEEYKVWFLYPIHKSIGMLILFPVLIRVVWRVMNGWPASVASTNVRWQQKLARWVHWILIVSTVLMPVSGMMMSGFGGYGLAIFGFELVGANPDPAQPGEMLAYNETLSSFAYQLHGALGTVLIVVISLHIAAALKHHFIDGDNVLKRMMGRQD